MVLFNVENCLKLSLASIHHTDYCYSLEKYQQDFNNTLQHLNMQAVDWSNTIPHDLGGYKVTLLNGQPIVFDYLSTEFCNEQGWDTDQLDIYIEDTPQNRINFLLLAIVLLEHTQSHTYFEVDSRIGGLYAGHMIELIDHANIIEAIEFCGFESKFVDYINATSTSKGGSDKITLNVSVGIKNKNALVEKINSIVAQDKDPHYEHNMRLRFGDNFPPQEEVCIFIQESMLNGSVIQESILFNNLSSWAKRSATLNKSTFGVEVDLKNTFTAKKITLGLAQELLSVEGVKVEINIYGKKHQIENLEQLEQLASYLSKSKIY